ncbi:hypothetical protein E2C01_080947 [Portunus trituberculatus]|uniref:Uncharacterized protein n=1 Tax=Portunus trituberculatus TaxID=210409 RepID=A0A5B7IKY3_PORTR|nr:hypothetical protein [Portunus trituberculatus]
MEGKKKRNGEERREEVNGRKVIAKTMIRVYLKQRKLYRVLILQWWPPHTPLSPSPCPLTAPLPAPSLSPHNSCSSTKEHPNP